MLKYWYIFQLFLKDALYFRGKILTNLLTLLFRVVILSILYSYTFDLIGGSLNGVDYQIAVWGIAFYFIVLSMNLRRIGPSIKHDVQSGNIEIFTNKPYNYLVYKMFEQLAKGLPNLIITGLVFIALLVAFVGTPESIHQDIWLVNCIIIFLGCILIAFLSYGIVGVTAFWLQDSDAAYWIYDKSVVILGGAYIPVILFPETVRKFSEYSPMGAMMFVSHISYSNFNSYASRLILTQIFWIIILSIFLYLFFNIAQKKLEVNGG